MPKSYRLGTLFGFPIEINLSFIMMLGVALLWWGGLAGVALMLVAFGSVLLHELGHALMARKLGVAVSGIELHFFGGAAKMTEQPRTAGDEIAIAAAGPAVSFALGGLGFLLSAVTGAWFFSMFGWLNTVIGAFNLVPALPMDGGRIFRALLSKRMGFYKATELSVRIARGFAIVLGVVGLATSHLYFILLAVVLWMMGTAELNTARFHSYRGDAPTVEVMPGSLFGGSSTHQRIPFGDGVHHPPREARVVRTPSGTFVIMR